MLDLLREGYRVWNEGGPAAAARDVWHPDIVYHYPPDFPGGGDVHGATAMAEHFATTWVDSIGVGVMQVVRAWWIKEGESTLVELTLRGTGGSSGAEVEVPYFQLHRMSEGRPVECWDYLSREQAFEAARALTSQE